MNSRSRKGEVIPSGTSVNFSIQKTPIYVPNIIAYCCMLYLFSPIVVPIWRKGNNNIVCNPLYLR